MEPAEHRRQPHVGVCAAEERLKNERSGTGGRHPHYVVFVFYNVAPAAGLSHGLDQNAEGESACEARAYAGDACTCTDGLSVCTLQCTLGCTARRDGTGDPTRHTMCRQCPRQYPTSHRISLHPMRDGERIITCIARRQQSDPHHTLAILERHLDAMRDARKRGF